MSAAVMTALSVLDLDDAASLEAADSLGTLRSAALGGAHVRAVAEGVREDNLGRLAGLRPRTLLLVTGPGRARRAAGLLVAALGARAGLPIVHVTTTPTWVGPLDVVLVSGDDAGDPRLVESVATAVRRGAEVVVAAPDEGPLRAAGAGRVIALPPRIRTTDHGALLRYLAAGLAVATAVDTTRSSWRAEELDHLADAVDAEALRDHPRHEVYDNPAKSLAARLQNRRAVLAGDGPATVELAGHGAEILLRAAGTVAAAADLADVLAGASMLASPNPPGAGYDPFFHDDQIDGPAPQEGVRVFVLGMSADRSAIIRRLRVLEDAEVVTVGEGPEHVGGDRTPAGDPPPGPTSDVEQIAVLALRLEMAAAYLGLLRGPGAGAASAPPALVPPPPTEGEPV